MNPDALDLWTSVKKVFPCGDLGEDWATIAADGFDPRRYCLVGDPRWAGDYGGRPVREVSRTPNRLLLEASGKGRAFLVSSEMAYPGWKAAVDGRPSSWVRVNHDFRGLVLEEGQERASMSFEPSTFRLGAFLSLLACALWVFGLVHRFGRSARA